MMRLGHILLDVSAINESDGIQKTKFHYKKLFSCIFKHQFILLHVLNNCKSEITTG